MEITISKGEDWRGTDPFLLVWEVACAGAGQPDTLRAELTAAGQDAPSSATVHDATERYKRAISLLGSNPNRYRISSDALLRRVTKETEVRSINRFVDANNAISLRSGWPVGSYDPRKILGAVTLRIGRLGELMVTLGKGNFEIEKVPVLADQESAFGCAISDSKRTAISDSTDEAVYVLYGFGESNLSDLIRYIEFLGVVACFNFKTPPSVVRS